MWVSELVIAIVIAAAVVLTVMRAVRIVPQARARNIERFGRYRKTLEPGLNFIVPFVDRVKPLIDLREQVVSFTGQPVITEDNLVVAIDTVLFFQVTDPRAADYEIVNYIQAIEQITATMLRSVIGSMDLEQTLTSRDKINTLLRGVLDDASGKWGIRVTRVEIKAIDPPKSVKDAMEKQMRAEREKRAAVLTAEGVRQSKILTAEGEKQSAILRAEGDKQSAILRAEGQALAISEVFQSIHRNDPDPKLLAYQYLQTLPQLASGEGNTFWVIPSEVTTALQAVTSAFSPAAAAAAAGAVAGAAGAVGVGTDAAAGAAGAAAGAVAPGAAGVSGSEGGDDGAAAADAASESNGVHKVKAAHDVKASRERVITPGIPSPPAEPAVSAEPAVAAVAAELAVPAVPSVPAEPAVAAVPAEPTVPAEPAAAAVPAVSAAVPRQPNPDAPAPHP